MSDDPGWVPDACTLPSVEQPLRAAEFDALFATGLRVVERPTATCLRLVLDRDAEQTARELTAREARCCSFFSFTFSTGSDGLGLQVDVPQRYVAVLDALARRAAATVQGAAARADR